VPYDQAVFQTSTVTHWTTQKVVVGTNPTTTVTTTLSNDPAATGTPAKKEKRQLGAGYAMTYTPYDESSGACMDAGSVLAQLQEIQSLGFNHIRLYGVDCDQLTTTANQAVELGFTLTLGVYIDATGTVRGYSDLATLIAWGEGNWPSNIAHINIGSCRNLNISNI
jgi:exo-beta-1,3-glucanase (GH17 family)